MPRYTDLDKAINALWEHATNVLESTDFDLFISDFYKMACRHSVEVLEAMPTIDVPERNVGKWIEEIGMLMCSECGDAWGTQQFDEVMSFNYCPNCGAYMGEGTEDEHDL